MAAGDRSDPRPRPAFRRAGVWQSEGRQRLCIARGEDKLLILACQLEISEVHVSYLLRGIKRPSLDLATTMYIALGIEAHLWGLAPFTKPAVCMRGVRFEAEERIVPTSAAQRAAE